MHYKTYNLNFFLLSFSLGNVIFAQRQHFHPRFSSFQIITISINCSQSNSNLKCALCLQARVRNIIALSGQAIDQLKHYRNRYVSLSKSIAAIFLYIYSHATNLSAPLVYSKQAHATAHAHWKFKWRMALCTENACGRAAPLCLLRNIGRRKQKQKNNWYWLFTRFLIRIKNLKFNDISTQHWQHNINCTQTSMTLTDSWWTHGRYSICDASHVYKCGGRHWWPIDNYAAVKMVVIRLRLRVLGRRCCLSVSRCHCLRWETTGEWIEYFWMGERLKWYKIVNMFHTAEAVIDLIRGIWFLC